MKTKIPTKEKRTLLILNTARKHIKKEMKNIKKENPWINKNNPEFIHNQHGNAAFDLGWYRAYHDILTIIGKK